MYSVVGVIYYYSDVKNSNAISDALKRSVKAKTTPSEDWNTQKNLGVHAIK